MWGVLTAMLCILTVKNCQGPQELYQSLETAAYRARYNFHHSHLLQLHCEICCVAEALCQNSLKPTSDGIMLHLHLHPWESMWTAKSQILQVYIAFAFKEIFTTFLVLFCLTKECQQDMLNSIFMIQLHSFRFVNSTITTSTLSS